MVIFDSYVSLPEGTIWLFNIANWKIHEQWRFLDGKKSSVNGPFSKAMLNNQRVNSNIISKWMIYQGLISRIHTVPLPGSSRLLVTLQLIYWFDRLTSISVQFKSHVCPLNFPFGYWDVLGQNDRNTPNKWIL